MEDVGAEDGLDAASPLLEVDELERGGEAADRAVAADLDCELGVHAQLSGASGRVAPARGELRRGREVADHRLLSDPSLDLLDPEGDLPTDPFGAPVEQPPALLELAAKGCDDLLVRLGHPRMMTRS